jgi:hypothetical protein
MTRRRRRGAARPSTPMSDRDRTVFAALGAGASAALADIGAVLLTLQGLGAAVSTAFWSWA